MYKSLRKILLIISTVILSVVLAACGTKSQTESQQESQPKPLTSQDVIEKYSEAVKNVNSFKYTSDFTSKTASKNPESSPLGPINLDSGISKDGVLSSEPFSILTNQTMTLTGTSLKISNYINESNELYTRAGNEPWKKTDSKKTQSEKADVVKKEIYNDKFLDALKNVITAHQNVENRFNISDLIDNGFVSGNNSKERRIMLGDLLKIGYYNAKQLLKALNSFNISREQFEEAVKKINEKNM